MLLVFIGPYYVPGYKVDIDLLPPEIVQEKLKIGNAA